MPSSYRVPVTLDTKKQRFRTGASARMSTEALTRWATRNPPATNRFFALQKNVMVERNCLDSWKKRFSDVFSCYFLVKLKDSIPKKQENAKTCCFVFTEVHLPVCGKGPNTRKSWWKSGIEKILKLQTKYRGSAVNLSTRSWGLRFATAIWLDLCKKQDKYKKQRQRPKIITPTSAPRKWRDVWDVRWPCQQRVHSLSNLNDTFSCAEPWGVDPRKKRQSPEKHLKFSVFFPETARKKKTLARQLTDWSFPHLFHNPINHPWFPTLEVDDQSPFTRAFGPGSHENDAEKSLVWLSGFEE